MGAEGIAKALPGTLLQRPLSEVPKNHFRNEEITGRLVAQRKGDARSRSGPEIRAGDNCGADSCAFTTVTISAMSSLVVTGAWMTRSVAGLGNAAPARIFIVPTGLRSQPQPPVEPWRRERKLQ